MKTEERYFLVRDGVSGVVCIWTAKRVQYIPPWLRVYVDRGIKRSPMFKWQVFNHCGASIGFFQSLRSIKRRGGMPLAFRYYLITNNKPRMATKFHKTKEELIRQEFEY